MTQEQTNPAQDAGAAPQPAPKPSAMQSKLLANIQRGVAGGSAADRTSRFAQAKAVEATTIQAAIADGGSQAAALVQGHPAAALAPPAEAASTGASLQRYVPGMPVRVGMLLEVDLDDLVESPVQPRVFFDEVRLAEIKASLAQH